MMLSDLKTKIIRKTPKSIKGVFLFVATMNDLFFSGSLRHKSPLDVLGVQEILNAKIKRIAHQIDEEDHNDPAILALITNLSDTIHSRYSISQTTNNEHLDLSYNEAIALIGSVFEELSNADTNNSAVQRIKAPFDLLKN